MRRTEHGFFYSEKLTFSCSNLCRMVCAEDLLLLLFPAEGQNCPAMLIVWYGTIQTVQHLSRKNVRKQTCRSERANSCCVFSPQIIEAVTFSSVFRIHIYWIRIQPKMRIRIQKDLESGSKLFLHTIWKKIKITS